MRIESASAGQFVTVVTLSGPVESSAQEELRARLEDPELASKRVVVDLTQATLYDSWPLPLLEESAKRFREHGGELVLISHDNGTVDPFVGESSLPGLRWFASLDEAIVELLADVAKLGEWPPPASE